MAAARRSHVLRVRAADAAIFRAIVRGAKKVETRAATPHHLKVKAGDALVLLCGAERAVRTVAKAERFRSVDALLKKHRAKDVHPGVRTAQELKAMYRSFSGYEEKLKKTGLVAWTLGPAPKGHVLRETAAHRALGRKAAAGAAKVLPLFLHERPRDPRPRRAIEAIDAWGRGKRRLGMAVVRKLSLDAHAAARACRTDAARFAARAAGHAVATWHVPRHADGVPLYASKAAAASKKA